MSCVRSVLYGDEEQPGAAGPVLHCASVKCRFHNHPISVLPYSQLPLSHVTVYRSTCRLFRVQLGAHALPIEVGRRLRMAQVSRVCPLCPGMHVSYERHHNFDFPAFGDICRVFSICFMIAIGPCVSSCGSHARKMLFRACCSSLTGLMER